MENNISCYKVLQISLKCESTAMKSQLAWDKESTLAILFVRKRNQVSKSILWRLLIFPRPKYFIFAIHLRITKELQPILKEHNYSVIQLKLFTHSTKNLLCPISYTRRRMKRMISIWFNNCSLNLPVKLQLNSNKQHWSIITLWRRPPKS